MASTDKSNQGFTEVPIKHLPARPLKGKKLKIPERDIRLRIPEKPVLTTR